MGSKKTPKLRTNITIDKELLDWLDQKTEDKIFSNRSHGVEFLITRKMEEEAKEAKELSKK